MKTRFKKYVAWFSVFVLAFQVVAVVPAYADTFPQLVSVNTDSQQLNGGSIRPSSSADGRYVTFLSSDSSCSLDGQSVALLRDRLLGTTSCIGVDVGVSPIISSNGQYIIYCSLGNIYVYNLATASSDYVATGDSAVINADGNYIAYSSSGSVYVLNRGTEDVINLGEGDEPAISGDGNKIVFSSWRLNPFPGIVSLISDLFVYNRTSGSTNLLALASGQPSLSYDGRFIAFTSAYDGIVSGDSNGCWDVFVQDQSSGNSRLVSVNQAGNQFDDNSGSPSISSDGRYVAFTSRYFGLNYFMPFNMSTIQRTIYVNERTSGKTESVGYLYSGDIRDMISLSGDSKYVFFDSTDPNLVSGDMNNNSDIFVVSNTLFKH